MYVKANRRLRRYQSNGEFANEVPRADDFAVNRHILASLSCDGS